MDKSPSPPPAVPQQSPTSTYLASASVESTNAWREDLKTLLTLAKERFPDVIWELEAGEGEKEEVWGHKAIIYARAPPSFQVQYFTLRSLPPETPGPYGSYPIPHRQSLYSLAIPLDDPLGSYSTLSNASSSTHVESPTPPTGASGILRISTSISPVLFSDELEYLYTGSGLSEAFEFLFGSEKRNEGEEDDKSRVDKLRHDLVFMWRSRLYSDIKISLAIDNPTSKAEDLTLPGDGQLMTVFSSHRFILVSRSQYFRNLLLSPQFVQPKPSSVDLPVAISLPSPPFTPPSLHFILGYIYTGTLNFSQRTFDLTTAFHIIRGANYLGLSALHSEIEARIIEEMMHGLFHAYLPFDQYESLKSGKWGVGGCICKPCQRRAPRVLEFAMASDISNNILTRGAQRALVNMFGEGWCSWEFGKLPVNTQRNIVRGVQKRATPMNTFPLLFAAQKALIKLNENRSGEAWVDDVRDMIGVVLRELNDVICSSCEDVFEQEEWVAILERDGSAVGDMEKVGWVMDAVRRGLSDKNAAMTYQTMVSAILLRTHISPNKILLEATSPVRPIVESARMDVLQWMKEKDRWQSVRDAGGFENIKSWAAKEISDEIDVLVEMLLAPRPKPPNAPVLNNGRLAPLPARVRRDASSISVRTIGENMTRPRGQIITPNDSPRILSASTRSVRSVRSVNSRISRTSLPSSSAAGATATAIRLRKTTDMPLQQIISETEKSPSRMENERTSQPILVNIANHKTFSAMVLYDFVAKGPYELDAEVGDQFLVVAHSTNRQWFIAKPIGKTGPVGAIPIRFVKIRESTTGKPVHDVGALIDRGDLPSFEEWKRTLDADPPAGMQEISSNSDDPTAGPTRTTIPQIKEETVRSPQEEPSSQPKSVSTDGPPAQIQPQDLPISILPLPEVEKVLTERPKHSWERPDCEDFHFLLNEEVFHPNELGITSEDCISLSQYVTKDLLAITFSDRVTIFNLATKGIRELKWSKESTVESPQRSTCIISPDGSIILRRCHTGRIEATEIRTKRLLSVLPDQNDVKYHDIRRAHWGSKNTVYIPVISEGCIIRWSFREVDPVAAFEVIQPMAPVTRHQRLDVFVTSDENWWVALGTTRERSGAGIESGMIQVHDVHNEESRLFPGRACCIFETKVYDQQAALLIRVDRSSDFKLSVKIHSIANLESGKQRFEPVDVLVDVLDPTDTPLQIFALDPLPIVSIITVRGAIYFFEIHTGTLLYSIDAPGMPAGLSPIHHQWPGGKGFCCHDKDGRLRRLSVNEKDLIGWVRRVLRNDTLASAIAIRTGLAGAEDVVLDDMFRNHLYVS